MSPVENRSRLRFRLGLALVLLIAAGGHVAFWYLPRERPVEPRGAALAGALDPLDSTGGLDWGLWLPYPHQNLPSLVGGSDELQRILGAGLAAGSGGELAPISFGPFALPPSRELLALGADDGSLHVAAEVYPGLAVLARAAGRIASNPWLAGGEVVEGNERYLVSWEGRIWTVRTPGTPEVPRPASIDDRPRLGLVALAPGAVPLPGGRYEIVAAAGTLTLVTLDGAPESTVPETANLEGSPALFALSGVASPFGHAGSGLVLFAGELDAGPTGLELPSSGIFYRADAADRWRLPGEKLLGLLGRDREEDAGPAQDGWRVRGWSDAAVSDTRELIASEPVAAAPRALAGRPRLPPLGGSGRSAHAAGDPRQGARSGSHPGGAGGARLAPLAGALRGLRGLRAPRGRRRGRPGVGLAPLSAVPGRPARVAERALVVTVLSPARCGERSRQAFGAVARRFDSVTFRNSGELRSIERGAATRAASAPLTETPGSLSLSA